MLIAIKKVIPIWIKKVPWYIFKSPQREVGYFTLLVELRGLLIFIFRSLYFVILKPKLQPLSICTGLKNRSENYLNYVVSSIAKMKNKDLIELSVFDCQSTDIDNLEAKIKEKWEGSLRFASENIGFTRAYSMNKAIEQASHDLIFISDADMSLPENLVYLCNKNVSKSISWFPVCFFLKKDKPAIKDKENGEWHPVGKGIFASRKENFLRIGGYDTDFKTWGGEDVDLWYRYYENGILPVRTKQKGLYHYFHESLKPPNFQPYSYKKRL